jgi:hypothetical protein
MEYNNGQFFNKTIGVMDFPEITKFMLETLSKNKLLEMIMEGFS